VSRSTESSVLGHWPEDQSACVCNLLRKPSAAEETSQAFSWRRLSAPFAQVNLPLDSPLLLWWIRACVCVSYKENTHTHTPRHRQMDTHALTENPVSHPYRACVPTRLPKCVCVCVWGQVDDGEGYSSCPGYRLQMSLLTVQLWAYDWSLWGQLRRMWRLFTEKIHPSAFVYRTTTTRRLSRVTMKMVQKERPSFIWSIWKLFFTAIITHNYVKKVIFFLGHLQHHPVAFI